MQYLLLILYINWVYDSVSSDTYGCKIWPISSEIGRFKLDRKDSASKKHVSLSWKKLVYESADLSLFYQIWADPWISRFSRFEPIHEGGGERTGWGGLSRGGDASDRGERI